MKIVFVLIILAIILLSVAIVVFFWAVKQRQFDDLEVHAYSVLKDDEYEKLPETKTSENSDLNESSREGSGENLDSKTSKNLSNKK